MKQSIFNVASSGAHSQKIFDVIFGIVAPVICIIIDPGIIRPPFDSCVGTLTVFNQYAMFMYAAMAIGIVSLTIWLALNDTLKDAAPFFAAVFAIGVLFALTIGITILPVSVYGLALMGLGALGFIPFLTALTYLRNCINAIQIARELSDTLFFKFAFAFAGVIFTLALPLFMQYRFPIPLPEFTGCS